MSAHGGPDEVTSGLVLALDAADIKSYPRTGTVWYDRSGVRNNVSSGSVYFVSNNGGAMYFINNPSNAFSINNNTSLQTTGDQTIEYFYTPEDRSTRKNVYAKAYGGEGTITHDTTGSITYYYGTAGGNASPYQQFSTNGTPLLDNNKTYHIVLVRDLVQQREGGRYIYWYINGVLNSRTTANYASASVSTLPLTIGTGYAGHAYGKLYSLRLYNRALSPQEVLQNYNANKSRFGL